MLLGEDEWHFGAVEGCEGRVIHYAEHPIVLDPLSPEEKRRQAEEKMKQAMLLAAKEKKRLFVPPP